MGKMLGWLKVCLARNHRSLGRAAVPFLPHHSTIVQVLWRHDEVPPRCQVRPLGEHVPRGRIPKHLHLAVEVGKLFGDRAAFLRFELVPFSNGHCETERPCHVSPHKLFAGLPRPTWKLEEAYSRIEPATQRLPRRA